jgi:hypothetical protein
MKWVGIKTKNEVVSDLIFKMAPPINDSCNRISLFRRLGEIQNQTLIMENIE